MLNFFLNLVKICEPLEISISNYVKPVPGPNINNWSFYGQFVVLGNNLS